jgi:hypothetical protein
MEKIKLVKKYHDQSCNIYYFWSENNANPKLETIVSCLAFEVKDGSWVKDFLSHSACHGAGEIIGLYKEKDYIILDDEQHDFEEDHIDRVVMHKNDFLKLVEVWQKVYSRKPDEIIITQDDDGNISITGKFADGREI